MVNVNKNKLLAAEIRLHKLKNNGRNEDSPGVIRKIEREIRQIKKDQGEGINLSFLLLEELWGNLSMIIYADGVGVMK